MKKIHRAWVTTNTRADGKKYYTAYVRLVGKIFWFIPVYYTQPVKRTIYENKLGVENQYYELGHEEEDPSYFGNKHEAEHILLQILDNYLDELQAEQDKRIVKRESTTVSFGSIDQ